MSDIERARQELQDAASVLRANQAWMMPSTFDDVGKRIAAALRALGDEAEEDKWWARGRIGGTWRVLRQDGGIPAAVADGLTEQDAKRIVSDHDRLHALKRAARQGLAAMPRTLPDRSDAT